MDRYGLNELVLKADESAKEIKDAVKSLERTINQYTGGSKRTNTEILSHLRKQRYEEFVRNKNIKNLDFIVDFINYTNKFHK